jgi:hypothetical protein
MTRFVVDAGAVLHLASTELEVAVEHELLARRCSVRRRCLLCTRPSIAARCRPTSRASAFRRIRQMPIRLLGDAVLRRRARDLAEKLGWASTYDAEYIALTQLQADAFVTTDAKLARSVAGVVTVAPVDALF